METFLVLAPPLAGIVALVYIIAANLLRVWLKHRLKLALLEKLQHDPAHRESLDELQALLDESTLATGRSVRVDYRVLGVSLAALGLLSLLAAWLIGEPRWTTGLYFGGVICLATGFILTLLGLVVRYVERLVAEPLHRV